MSSLYTTILDLLFTEAEQKGRTRNFRVCIGLESDGSSSDKLSLDLRFNPWDSAITHRSECEDITLESPAQDPSLSTLHSLATQSTYHFPAGLWGHVHARCENLGLISSEPRTPL